MPTRWNPTRAPARVRGTPLVLLPVFAAGASVLTREWLDASIVLTIVIATVAARMAQAEQARRQNETCRRVSAAARGRGA